MSLFAIYREMLGLSAIHDSL